MKFLLLTTEYRRAEAEVLRESILGHHPAADVSSFLAGERSGVLRSAGVTRKVSFSGDGLRWVDLAVGLGTRSAAWAVLPWVLADMAGAGRPSGGEPVVVIDDSFVALGPLDGLADPGTVMAARARHVDGGQGAWGGFLPGLLVASAPEVWGEWWTHRVLERVRSPEEPVGCDPWWDLPRYAEAITDPTYRLSPSTAGEVHVDDTGAVGPDGQPPTLVDFADFDPTRPWRFADPGAESPVSMEESPGLRGLCQAHAGRLLEAGWRPQRAAGRLLPGLAATTELRAWYRGLLAERSGDLPPNPFVPGEAAAFLELLRERGVSEGTGINAHVDLLYERRDDLRTAFPHARWKDRAAYRRWLWSHGLSEGETTLLTLPEPAVPPAVMKEPAARRPFGVNLVGYLGAELGLGVAARRLQRAFDAAGIPHAAVSYDRTSSTQRVGATGDTTAPYHFSLLLITPDQLPLFVADVGEGFLAGHHNIGLWYWESDVVVPQQRTAFGFVDEIWVATNYLTKAFGGQGLPVKVVPSPLVFDQPELGEGDRQRLGLDDRFTFLFSFDHLSVSERKNPLGLAEAYRRAFPDPDNGSVLVLKSINGHLFPDDHERIVYETADREDIVVRDELLPAADRMALVAVADAYVSLHRSEGLGLTMAEAMAVGTPVIATGYSGNLDFMPEGSALLVPAGEVDVGEGQYYPANGHWADPDLDAAAEMMRSVKADPSLASELAAKGRAALEPFGYEQVGQVAVEALMESWRAAGA